MVKPDRPSTARHSGSAHLRKCESPPIAAACWVGRDTLLSDADVLRVLAALTDRSLVQLEETSGGRYRLLETVRHYAAAKLAAHREGDTVRHRHLAYYLSIGSASVALLDGEAAEHLDALELERDNVLAALSWAIGSGRGDDARTLAADLLVFWMARYPAEGLARLEAVIDGPTDDPVSEVRAKNAAAWMALCGEFDAERALRYARQALISARELERADLTAVALNHLAWAATLAAPEEAQAAFEEAAGLHEADGDAPRLVHALAGMAFLAVQEGDCARARDLLSRSLQTTQVAADEIGIRRALAFLGSLAAIQGELDQAERLLLECLTRARRLGDRYFTAHALDYLAVVAIHRGDYTAARASLEEALPASRLANPMAIARTLTQRAHLEFAVGDIAGSRNTLTETPTGVWGVNWYLARRLPLLAELAIADHDLDAARELVDDAVRAARQPERPWALGLARMAEARLLLCRGSIPQATAAAHAALATLLRSGHRPDALDALELVAELRNHAGHPEEAARLLGAARAARAASDIQRPPVYEAAVRATLTGLEAALGEAAEGFSRAGAALSLEAALAYASRGRGRRRRPSAGWESLTPGEHLVADLVSEGLSNAGIAERLFVAPATVRAHLGHIYTKLGITSRAQLAAAVARRAGSGLAEGTRRG